MSLDVRPTGEFTMLGRSSLTTSTTDLNAAQRARTSASRVRLFTVGAALVVGFGASACTVDESQQPAIDPADKVLFTGDRTKAVPTTEATTATTTEQTAVTYRYGSTTTTTAPESSTETTEAASTETTEAAATETTAAAETTTPAG